MKTSIDRSPLTSARAVSWRRRQPPSPLTSDHHEPYRVPRDDVECDALLASAESRMNDMPMIRHEVVADLARFVGVASRVWTAVRRLKLERILANAGPLSLGPILQAVAAAPREEVMDQAVSVLAASAAQSEEVAAALVDALTGVVPNTGPAGREVMLRALTLATGTIPSQQKMRVAFSLARSDSSPGVRDAAVQALATMGGPDAVAILTALVSSLAISEQHRVVQMSIQDALETLSER